MTLTHHEFSCFEVVLVYRYIFLYTAVCCILNCIRVLKVDDEWAQHILVLLYIRTSDVFNCVDAGRTVS